MSDRLDDELQNELRLLPPRRLSAGLEERVLRQIDSLSPTTSPPARRPRHWTMAAIVAGLAVSATTVIAVAVWWPRPPASGPQVAESSPNKELQDRRQSAALADEESGDRRDAEVDHRAPQVGDWQTPTKHGQTPNLDSESSAGESGARDSVGQAQAGQQSPRVGEKAQTGGEKVGGFWSSGDTAGSRWQTGDRNDKQAWHRLAAGEFADVDVERRLYERPDDEHFFVRVRITNKTDHAIGVQLGGTSVIYPNQWGVHAVDHRTIIDERRIDFPVLDDEQKAALLRAFAAKSLHEIRPGQSTTYFRAFNGKNCRDEAAAESGYLIISLDGRLLITDGREVNDVRPKWTDDGGRDLVLPCPVSWQRIGPMEAIVDDEE